MHDENEGIVPDLARGAEDASEKDDVLHSCDDVKMDAADTTDGRSRCEWESRYPEKARFEIRLESFFIFFLFFLGATGVFSVWRGWLVELFGIPSGSINVFNKYAYYSISGFLGGVVFGIKYLYRVVARGFWHQDRRVWRLMSPFVAFTISFVVGCLIESSFMLTNRPLSTASIISIGFLSGYFADEAVGKMYEIANVIFGKSSVR